MKRDTKRDEEICDMFCCGFTLEEIAGKFSVSQQRIGVITKRNGIASKDGGAHLLSVKRKAILSKEKDLRYIKKYGCDRLTYKSINKARDDRGCSPIERYTEQRLNARSRKIQWCFDFYSWFMLWQKSGKWDKRGRNLGQYVMGRKDDKGPYSVDNVEIVTCSENISNGYYYSNKVSG